MLTVAISPINVKFMVAFPKYLSMICTKICRRFSVRHAAIPGCVMGGVCITLYGFIAVSGLKMIQHVNLNLNKNLFVVSSILLSAIGGLTLNLGKVTITSIACALILGIITNVIVSKTGDEE